MASMPGTKLFQIQIIIIEIANVPSSDNNHIKLCHTKGVHYDLIVLRNGTYPKDFPNHTMCM